MLIGALALGGIAAAAMAVNDDSNAVRSDAATTTTLASTTTSAVSCSSGEKKSQITDASGTREVCKTTTTVPRAEYEAAFAAEITRACGVVNADPGLDATTVVQWNSAWVAIGKSSDQLVIEVDKCAEPARAAAWAKIGEAERQRKLASCGPPSVDGIVRNPDGSKGSCFVMYVEITQFDAATGLCTFRGYWDKSRHEYSFDYAGDNAVFTAGDAVSSCSVLDGVDQNDVIKAWVTSAGSFSYDTQIGGSTTVPLFSVDKVEMIEKG